MKKQKEIPDASIMAEEQEQQKILYNDGKWNSRENVSEELHYMHVMIMFTEKAFGTSPSNKELYDDYIASKAKTEKDRAEELDEIEINEKIDKHLIRYNRGTFIKLDNDVYYDHIRMDSNRVIADHSNPTAVSNVPFLYDYQIRGFFKDSCGLLARADKTFNGEENPSASLKAYKKCIDGGIFVFPRRIAIITPDTYVEDDGITVSNSFNDDGTLKVTQRPMRKVGATGEFSTIISSETIPKNSFMKFTIGYTNKEYREKIISWLNYGRIHGMSAWRNAGHGTFIWREIDDRYMTHGD